MLDDALPGRVATTGCVGGYQRNHRRVFSFGQRIDPGRRFAALREQFPNHDMVRDVASGIHLTRPGVLRLMDAVCTGSVTEVVDAHQDRLRRFAKDLVKWQSERVDRREMVLDPTDRTPQAELCWVGTVFGARLNGMRRNETIMRHRTNDESTAQQAAEVGANGDGADVPEGACSKKRSR